MSAPFRATDEVVRLPSTISATIARIAHHHNEIQGLIEDLERAHRSGADLAALDNRLGYASDFAAQNGRRLNALRTGSLDAVQIGDLEFLKRFAPASVRQAAE